MRADRLVKLLLWLQGRPQATVPELARALEVSERTVHRDLDALSTAGVPVVTTRGQHGGVSLMPGWKTELTGLNRAELQALATLSPVRGLDDVGLSKPLRAGLMKLAAAVPSFQQPQLEYARQRLHVDATSWWGGREQLPFLGRLRDALWQNQRVALDYRDFDGKRSRRLVEPYGLVLKADRWYLVAFVEGKPRTYRGSRIEGVRTRSETFTRDPGFDLAAYWHEHSASFATKRAVYEVQLRLSADAAAALRRERPAVDQQRLDAAPVDRRGRRTVTLDFERETIALSQLCQVGAGVEVLAPEALRSRLRALGETLRAAYGEQPGAGR